MLEILVALNTLGLGWLLLLNVKRPNKNSSKVILDSCALIDGRILGIATSGFIQGELIIPKFILRELQMLADGSDAHKRSRARYGLEVAEELKEIKGVSIKVDESLKVTDKTDELLILLAKKSGAALLTTDYNLGKVASVEGVRVMNVNELSLALRSTALPGEEKEVKILQKGDGSNQGVGYLEDGVMVIVYGAAKLVGTTQKVIIERHLQTVAGKMCFAHLKPSSQKKR